MTKYYCILHQKYLKGKLNPKCLQQLEGKNKGKKCKHLIILEQKGE